MSLQKRISETLDARSGSSKGWTQLLTLALMDRWLLPTIAGLILLLAGTLSLFLKIIPSTPPGLEPTISISVLDYIQAWSFRRQAHRHESAGDPAAARLAWKGVVDNNPGDEQAIQNFLLNFPYATPSLSLGKEAQRYSEWLLALNQGEASDYAPVVTALAHCRRHIAVVKLLRTKTKKLSLETEAVFLQSLFHTGQFDQFKTLWLEAKTRHANNTTLRRFALAQRAITTRKQSDIGAFSQQLTTQDIFSPLFDIERKLALRTACAVGNEALAKSYLKSLEKARLATLPDYLFYWHAKLREGRVQDLAKNITDLPSAITEHEAYSLITLLRLAGFHDEALSVTQAFLIEFGNPIQLWRTYADTLIRQDRWGVLKQTASRMQATESLSSLWAIAKFWEGLAEWHLDHRKQARNLFSRISDFPAHNETSRLAIVAHLQTLGEDAIASQLLDGMDATSDRVRRFFFLRSEKAIIEQDLNALHQAAVEAHQSDPSASVYANNLAAALLLKKENLPEALKLSTQAVQKEPGNISYRLTHIHALSLNRQFDEAKRMLVEIDPTRLNNPVLANDWMVAQLEIAALTQQAERVIELSQRISPDLLMPESVQWIEAARTAAINDINSKSQSTKG